MCLAMRAIDHRPRPVELPGPVQLGQQDLVQLVPHPGLVPVPQPGASRSFPSRSRAPAAATPTGCRYAARTRSPAQALAVIQRQPARIPTSPGPHRQQRLNPHPQVIRYQPRRALSLPPQLVQRDAAKRDMAQRALSVSSSKGCPLGSEAVRASWSPVADLAIRTGPEGPRPVSGRSRRFGGHHTPCAGRTRPGRPCRTDS